MQRLTVFNVSRYLLLVSQLVLVTELVVASEARFPNDNDRPDRLWLSGFEHANTVIVRSSIDEAINRCPANQACLLLVEKLHLTQSVYINRSNISIVGMPNNAVSKSLTSDATFFTIESNTQNVAISHLNFLPNNTLVKEVNGIVVYGNNIQNIYLANNRMQGLSASENAHAIAVYGTGSSEQRAISNVIIENNFINAASLGSSEAIAINGNVSKWLIKGNTLTNLNNIAIDAIGGEGTVKPITTANGRVLPSEWDAARLGFIESNVVQNVSTSTNPAYGNAESWAAAIYVDGAHSINISDNQIESVPWAIEVGAENCVVASHVSIRNNDIGKTHYGDILLGGYQPGGFIEERSINCDPEQSEDADEGHGYVHYISSFENRRFDSTLKNKTSNGERARVKLQYRTRHIQTDP